MNRWLLIALALLMASPALAVMPDEVLDDPALEARAREVSKELRCLVCQNQSIDDSNADLGVLVRERLVAGDSNDQALDFIVARYGDYVLLKPPVQANTLVLWAGPVVIFLIAGGILLVRVRRKTPLSSAPPALTADEEARVLRALDSDRKERD